MKVIANKHSQCTVELTDEELGTMRYFLYQASKEQGSKVWYMRGNCGSGSSGRVSPGVLETEERQLVKVEALVEDLEAAVKAI